MSDRCGKRFGLKPIDGEWAECFCLLPAGHSGTCSPSDPDEFPEQEVTDWHAFFKALRAGRVKKGSDIVLRKPWKGIPEDVDPTALPGRSGLGQLAKAAMIQGWDLQIETQNVFTGDSLYENGNLKPGKNEDLVAIQARRGPERFGVLDDLIVVKMKGPDGSLKIARPRNMTELKKLIAGSIELADILPKDHPTPE